MRQAGRIIRAALMTLGALTLAVLIVTLLEIGLVRLEGRLDRPRLNSGVISGYGYDDGHIWYSDLDMGSFTIRIPHGDGKEHFFIEVTDGAHTDLWEVDHEDYITLGIGQTVTRSQVQ